jgi:hypothetical protein
MPLQSQWNSILQLKGTIGLSQKVKPYVIIYLLLYTICMGLGESNLLISSVHVKPSIFNCLFIFSEFALVLLIAHSRQEIWIV